MTRSLFVAAVCFTTSFAMLGCGNAQGKACEKDVLLDKPQVCTDRASIGFAQEFNSGTLIGAKPIDSLALRNGGTADLEISSITYSGDPEFKVTASWDGNLTDNMIPPVKVRQDFVVQPDGGLFNTSAKPAFREAAALTVEFAPTTAKAYSGSITINSNAQNAGLLTIAVTGCGIPADGGTSPCYKFIDCSKTNDAGIGVCADGGR